MCKQPNFEVTDETILIIDKPHKSALTNEGESNFKNIGKLSSERKCKFKNGKIKEIWFLPLLMSIMRHMLKNLKTNSGYKYDK